MKTPALALILRLPGSRMAAPATAAEVGDHGIKLLYLTNPEGNAVEIAQRVTG